MATRTTAHGLTADVERKIAASYDVEREKKAREWIQQLTQEEIQGDPGMDNFHLALKDGVILCKLVNVIQAGVVKKINTSKMVFKQQENISLFLQACEKFGVPSHSSFQTVDLYEKRNMPQVLNTIYAVSSAAQKMGFGGPFIPGTVKIADKNVRQFDEETLKEGQKHSSLFTSGTNKGASQAGMTSFGTQRKL